MILLLKSINAQTVSLFLLNFTRYQMHDTCFKIISRASILVLVINVELAKTNTSFLPLVDLCKHWHNGFYCYSYNK